MTRALPHPIELREYRSRELPAEHLREQDAETLWRHHDSQVAVQFPSPRTQGRWKLTAQGWVGFLQVGETLALRLLPKVPIENIFRMLEVAYDLQSFRFLPGLTDCRSLEEFYERLARIFALRVLARSLQGFHRAYLGHRDRLPAVRGRIDLDRTIRAPWRVQLTCQFEEHTADIEDNRLLLWTLDRIRRNAACRRPQARHAVRTAFGRLQGVVTPQPFTAADCIDRTYNRLNEDYRALHALCRFFLESTGPSHEGGGHRNLPFLVDMARLFELFVSEWLRQHLPLPLSLTSQEKVYLDVESRVRFVMDMVLYDRPGGRPRAVLDTKYKSTGAPSTQDIAQVVAYAEAKGCREALLIYPRIDRRLDLEVGAVRVRTTAFGLDSDLDAAGKEFLQTLPVDPRMHH